MTACPICTPQCGTALALGSTYHYPGGALGLADPTAEPYAQQVLMSSSTSSKKPPAPSLSPAQPLPGAHSDSPTAPVHAQGAWSIPSYGLFCHHWVF